MALIQHKDLLLFVRTYLIVTSFYYVTAEPEVNYGNHQDTDFKDFQGGVDRGLKDGFPSIMVPKSLLENISKRSTNSGFATSVGNTKRGSQSHAQTIWRVENPCAGETQELYPVRTPPTAASVGIFSRGLLIALGGEAIWAQRAALNIQRQFEDMGLNHQDTFSVFGNMRSMQLTGESRRTKNYFESRAVVVLKDLYSKLARSAIVLQQIADDRAGGRFTHLIDNLTENGIYNLLCGIKVVMGMRGASFEQADTAMLVQTPLPTPKSEAWRLARNYLLIHNVAIILGQTGFRLTVLSQQI